MLVSTRRLRHIALSHLEVTADASVVSRKGDFDFETRSGRGEDRSGCGEKAGDEEVGEFHDESGLDYERGVCKIGVEVS